MVEFGEVLRIQRELADAKAKLTATTQELTVRGINQWLSDQITQKQFGRNATLDEIKDFTSIDVGGLSAFHRTVINNLPSGEVVANWLSSSERDTLPRNMVKSLEPTAFASDAFKDSARIAFDNKLREVLKSKLGITDSATVDKIKEGFSTFNAVDAQIDSGAGGMDKILAGMDKDVDGIKIARNAAITALYTTKYGEIVGNTDKLSENLDEYLDSISDTDIGINLLTETDPDANRALMKVVTSTIGDAINADESVQEILTTQAAETDAEAPFGQEEVTKQLNEARATLAEDLANASGNRTEALRDAFKAFTDKIPAEIANIREIAEERLTERLEELPETFGEFGARLGLDVGQSGQLQKSLAEEAVKATAETERGLAEFQISREREAAGIGLNLEQNIAEFEAQREGRIATLGFDIEQIGTQIGREDFTTLLQQRFQQAQIANQQEYQTFLTQMGYTQNRIAQQEAFSQQQSMLFQQQGFQSAQSVLDRQLQERLFDKSAGIAEEQRSRQRKSARTSSFQSLVGGGLGATAGFFLGGPAGALLGFGLGSGSPSATSAGAFLF